MASVSSDDEYFFVNIFVKYISSILSDKQNGPYPLSISTVTSFTTALRILLESIPHLNSPEIVCQFITTDSAHGEHSSKKVLDENEFVVRHADKNTRLEITFHVLLKQNILAVEPPRSDVLTMMMRKAASIYELTFFPADNTFSGIDNTNTYQLRCRQSIMSHFKQLNLLWRDASIAHAYSFISKLAGIAFMFDGCHKRIEHLCARIPKILVSVMPDNTKNERVDGYSSCSWKGASHKSFYERNTLTCGAIDRHMQSLQTCLGYSFWVHSNEFVLLKPQIIELYVLMADMSSKLKADALLHEPGTVPVASATTTILEPPIMSDVPDAESNISNSCCSEGNSTNQSITTSISKKRKSTDELAENLVPGVTLKLEPDENKYDDINSEADHEINSVARLQQHPANRV